MKTVLTLSILSLSLYSLSGFAAELSAVEIMNKNFMTSRFIDSTNETTMRLIEKNGNERIRETTSFTKLMPGTTDNQRLITFIRPTDVKGSKILMKENSKGEDDIWIYLPALKKVRRLVASNKKDSFVGSDFTYADVIGYKVDEWEHKVLEEKKEDSKECWMIESKPKTPEISSLFKISKRLNCVAKDSFIALTSESYDQGGKLVKRYKAKDIVLLDEKNNKWAAMFQEAVNTETGHRTTVEFKNYKVNQRVSDEVFTTRFLEKK